MHQEAYAHITEINGLFQGLMTDIEEKNLDAWQTRDTICNMKFKA